MGDNGGGQGERFPRGRSGGLDDGGDLRSRLKWTLPTSKVIVSNLRAEDDDRFPNQN
jgi:hypothetical protein